MYTIKRHIADVVKRRSENAKAKINLYISRINTWKPGSDHSIDRNVDLVINQ